MSMPAAFEEAQRRAVKEKIRLIRELDIKVHFEDSTSSVRQMREALPDVAIVQYAGRLW